MLTKIKRIDKLKEWFLAAKPVIWPTIVMLIVGFYNIIIIGKEMPLWWWIMFIGLTVINIPWYIVTKVRKGKGK
jgi:hypothetical protein